MSRGMTYWNCCSFDMYSNRNEPPSSEKSETRRQNVSSLSSRGNGSAEREGTMRSSALNRTTTIRIRYLREHPYSTVTGINGTRGERQGGRRKKSAVGHPTSSAR